MTPAVAIAEPKSTTIQSYVEREIEELLASLPDPAQLTATERRGKGIVGSDDDRAAR